MASIAISAFFKDSIFLTFLKISKNSLNNKCLFSTNSIINNYSSLAGLIPANSEFLQNLAEKKNNFL